MEELKCCSNHTHKIGVDFKTSKTLNGIVKFYCQKPNCPKFPCINFRVNKKVRRYMNAFGDSDVYHMSDLDCDVGMVYKILKKMFNKVIVYDCFSHSEALVSEPKNEYVLDGCNKVTDFNKELNGIIRRHMITTESEWMSGQRVRTTEKLNLNSPIHRMPTVDGYYVWSNGNIGDDKKGVKTVYKLPCETHFQLPIIDSDGYYDLNYPQMLSQDNGSMVLQHTYHFTDKTFLRYNDCEGCDGHRCDFDGDK